MKRQQKKLNMAKSQVGNTIILGPMTAVDSGPVQTSCFCRAELNYNLVRL